MGNNPKMWAVQNGTIQETQLQLTDHGPMMTDHYVRLIDIKVHVVTSASSPDLRIRPGQPPAASV